VRLIIKGDFTLEGDVPEKLMKEGERFKWIVLETMPLPTFRITQFSKICKKLTGKELSEVKE